jgi:TIR domain
VKVFLSYAREDADFALHLATDLRADEVDLWVDQLDIPPGAIWDREVQRALEVCSHLLVVLSPASVDSDNVMNEVHFALDKSKSVVPALYKQCDIPFRLRRFHYVDFMIDYRNGLSALIQVLPRRPESRALTEPPNEKAQTAKSGDQPSAQEQAEERSKSGDTFIKRVLDAADGRMRCYRLEESSSLGRVARNHSE